MRPWLVILGALLAVIGAVAGIETLTFATEISNLRNQQSAQLAQVQRADQRARVGLEGEIAAIRGAFTVAEARIGGTHRDLITCADWQVMFLPVSGTDSFGGQLAASAGPPPLPQHCVNQ